MKKEQQNYDKLMENKKKFDAEKLTFNGNVLRYQSQILTRSDLKESSCELSKISA